MNVLREIWRTCEKKACGSRWRFLCAAEVGGRAADLWIVFSTLCFPEVGFVPTASKERP